MTGSIAPQTEAAPGGGPYVLRLYITGLTARSVRAISNIRVICQEHLKGRYDLEVVDLSQHPELAEAAQIIAAPTLINGRRCSTIRECRTTLPSNWQSTS